jgi:hypothetical protein
MVAFMALLDRTWGLLSTQNRLGIIPSPRLKAVAQSPFVQALVQQILLVVVFHGLHGCCQKILASSDHCGQTDVQPRRCPAD